MNCPPSGVHVLVALLPFASACGGSSTPPAQSASGSPAGGAEPVVRPITQAQLEVAHFKSADGMVGLVLDRTGEKAKLRVDGAQEVIELTKEEDRHGGELRGWYFVAPDGKRPVYISSGGGVRYFHGRDDFWMTSDRKADPLPPATVTGTYVAPPPAYEALVKQLGAASVRTRIPELTAASSADIAKIGEAISRATADMFVHYVSQGASSWLPSPAPTPEEFSGISYGAVAHQTDDAWDPKATGLPKHGGKIRGFSDHGSKGNHINVMKMAGYPPPLAENTPGLVWEVDGARAVFVTLDGGRYVIDLSSSDKGASLAKGAGSLEKWPAPLQHALLDVHTVSSLAKAGALPQKAIDDLVALDDEWNKCAQKTWKGAERGVDSGRFTEADRKDWVKKVEKACAKSVQKQEAALLKLTEERIALRKALFEKAKARAAAVGADR